MPLRKFVQRIREHDWLSVAIELVVVVAGVYIGLQASNWNQDRQDDQRGREYLQRFDVELRRDAQLLASIRGFQQQVAAYGAGAIGYAEEGRLVKGSAWQTLLAYYQASQVWPYRQNNATFQEIRSSGELRLIRNAALRARLSGHYDESAGSRAIEVVGVVPRYREHVRALTPWPVQKYIWAHCYRGDTTGQHLQDCAAPISEAEAQAVIQRYRQDEALTGELRFWLASLDTGELVLPSIQREAEAIDAEVRRELGLPPATPVSP